MMHHREKAVLIRTVSTEDATLAEARILEGDAFAMGFHGRGLAEAEALHGIAKRDPQDTPDPVLGETLATARALQKVVDGLWVQVKERCPDIVTPRERAVDKAHTRGYRLGVKAMKERMEAREAAAYRRGRSDGLRAQFVARYPSNLEDIILHHGDPGPIGTTSREGGSFGVRLSQWRSRR